MKSIIKLGLVTLAALLIFPIFAGAQDTIDAINNMAREETKRAQDIESSVEMFIVDEAQGVVDEKDMYQTIDDSRPSPNKIVQAYMGDRMIVQRKGYFADCIIPHFSVDEDYIGGWNYFIKADVPVCKEKSKSKKYIAPYVNGTNGKNDKNMPIKLTSKENGTYKICISDWGFNAACKDDLTESDFYNGPAFVSVKGGLQRTIEYAGKSGNHVNFIYSEFKDGMARGAFTRDFGVDLSEGNVAAYKGAVFEIIEANNAQITYKGVLP